MRDYPRPFWTTAKSSSRGLHKPIALPVTEATELSHYDEPDFPADYAYCRLKLSERSVSLYERAEPGDYIMDISGLVQWSGNDEEKAINLGAFSCKLIDGDSAINDRMSLHDVFDHEKSTFDIYEDLYDFDTGDLREDVTRMVFGPYSYAFNSNLLVLDRLVIYPEHRGNGLGLLVLRGLMAEFSSFASLVVMKPYPLQFEGKTGPSYEPLEGLPREHWGLNSYKGRLTKSRAQLRRHYAKLGFILVPKTEYMVRDAQIPLPSVDELLKGIAGN